MSFLKTSAQNIAVEIFHGWNIDTTSAKDFSKLFKRESSVYWHWGTSGFWWFLLSSSWCSFGLRFKNSQKKKALGRTSAFLCWCGIGSCIYPYFVNRLSGFQLHSQVLTQVHALSVLRKEVEAMWRRPWRSSPASDPPRPGLPSRSLSLGISGCLSQKRSDWEHLLTPPHEQAALAAPSSRSRLNATLLQPSFLAGCRTWKASQQEECWWSLMRRRKERELLWASCTVPGPRCLCAHAFVVTVLNSVRYFYLFHNQNIINEALRSQVAHSARTANEQQNLSFTSPCTTPLNGVGAGLLGVGGRQEEAFFHSQIPGWALDSFLEDLLGQKR